VVDLEPDMISQIDKDVNRTFPKQQCFAENSLGIQVLTRLLLTYTKYANHVGYVQGMNFVCGSLLYHCREEAAFWIFVMLMEDYELEEVYIKGLPGLYKHSLMAERLLSVEKSLTEIRDRLNANKIRIEMFATDWIFTLFSNVIPIVSMVRAITSVIFMIDSLLNHGHSFTSCCFLF
jgi:TBC1 domain family member 10